MTGRLTRWWQARRERRAAEHVRAVLDGRYGHAAKLAAIVAVDASRGEETRWVLPLGNGWRQECVSRDGMTMSVHVRNEPDRAVSLRGAQIATGGPS